MTAIKVQELWKSFDEKAALRGVSMTVNRGDVYGFLGPNGSGKTTTLRILLGILPRESGLVTVLDMDPADGGRSLRRQVNILPESHGFYPWMRADEYLVFFAELYGLRLTSADCRARLAQVGLDADDARPVRTFSRGMKQRLGIARALVNDPQLLLLDEPTSGLDPKGRKEVHDLLLSLNRDRGMTIVISTHILDDVERLCNRIAILDRGIVVFEGFPDAAPRAASARYRFRFENEDKIPAKWDYPGITLVERDGSLLTCSITGLSPAEAVKSLVDRGLPLVEAVPASGGIEGLYLKSVTGDDQ